ncbi:MAG: hypothetical protein M0T74_13790 [Desulfitobacterium hafniense]|nr:hypothetical protein [Desulfitobacterium hafniense]
MTYSFYITPEDYRIAEQNGISPKVLETRIRRFGWHKERAITQPVQKFKNHKEWAKIAEQNGIPYHTFYQRLRLGWTNEQSATTPKISPLNSPRRYRRYPVEYSDRAKELGIYRLFLHRMHCGWDLTKACSTPAMTKSEVGKLGKRSRWRGAAR